MTTIRLFFSKLGHFFTIFKKGQGRPPPPSLYLRTCNSVDNCMNVVPLLFFEVLSGVQFLTWSVNLCASCEVETWTHETRWENSLRFADQNKFLEKAKRPRWWNHRPTLSKRIPNVRVNFISCQGIRTQHALTINRDFPCVDV